MDKNQIIEYVKKKAPEFGVDSAFALGLFETESQFDPMAVNPKTGAAGVAQLMPDTVKGYEVKDVHNWQENVDAGLKLLSDLDKRYEGNQDNVLKHYGGFKKADPSGYISKVTTNAQKYGGNGEKGPWEDFVSQEGNPWEDFKALPSLPVTGILSKAADLVKEGMKTWKEGADIALKSVTPTEEAPEKALTQQPGKGVERQLSIGMPRLTPKEGAVEKIVPKWMKKGGVLSPEDRNKSYDVWAISEETNLPPSFVEKHYDEVTAELGMRGVPTRRDMVDTMFKLAIASGLATHPLATIVGVTGFMGISELESLVVQKNLGEKYKFGTGRELKEFLGDLKEPFDTVADAVEFVGKAAVVGGGMRLGKKAPAKARASWEKFTRETVKEYGLPRIVTIDPAELRAELQTGGILEKDVEDMYRSLGLKGSEIRQALKKGLVIEVSTEKVVMTQDRPWFASLKRFFGLKSGEISRTVVGRESTYKFGGGPQEAPPKAPPEEGGVVAQLPAPKPQLPEGGGVAAQLPVLEPQPLEGGGVAAQLSVPEPLSPEKAVLHPLSEDEQKDLGVRFEGMQETSEGEEIPVYTDLETKSTFFLPKDKSVKEKVEEMRENWRETEKKIEEVTPFEEELSAELKRLEKHKARAEGLGLSRDTVVKGYLSELESLIKKKIPAKAELVERAIEAYYEGDYNKATQLSEAALGYLHQDELSTLRFEREERLKGLEEKKIKVTPPKEELVAGRSTAPPPSKVEVPDNWADLVVEAPNSERAKQMLKAYGKSIDEFRAVFTDKLSKGLAKEAEKLTLDQVEGYERIFKMSSDDYRMTKEDLLDRVAAAQRLGLTVAGKSPEKLRQEALEKLKGMRKERERDRGEMLKFVLQDDTIDFVEKLDTKELDELTPADVEEDVALMGKEGRPEELVDEKDAVFDYIDFTGEIKEGEESLEKILSDPKYRMTEEETKKYLKELEEGGEDTELLYGGGPSTEQILGAIKTAKDSFPHVVELGKRAWKEGNTGYEKFRDRMKELLGELWDKVKGLMAEAYERVKEWNKKLGERGGFEKEDRNLWNQFRNQENKDLTSELKSNEEYDKVVEKDKELRNKLSPMLNKINRGVSQDPITQEIPKLYRFIGADPKHEKGRAISDLSRKEYQDIAKRIENMPNTSLEERKEYFGSLISGDDFGYISGLYHLRPNTTLGEELIIRRQLINNSIMDAIMGIVFSKKDDPHKLWTEKKLEATRALKIDIEEKMRSEGMDPDSILEFEEHGGTIPTQFKEYKTKRYDKFWKYLDRIKKEDELHKKEKGLGERGELFPEKKIEVKTVEDLIKILPENDVKNLEKFMEGSKVRDIVWHGTDVSGLFTQFDTKSFEYGFDLGSHFGTKEAANKFAMDDPKYVKENDRPRVMPFVINIKNPLKMPDVFGGGFLEPDSPIIDYLVKEKILSKSDVNQINEFFDMSDNAKAFDLILEKIKDYGYDGIEYTNKIEDRGSTSYIIFDSKQVKSAFGNVGTFDPTKPNFLYGGGPSIKQILTPLRDVGQDLYDLAMKLPEFTDLERLVGEYTGGVQVIDWELSQFAKQINREVPKEVQESISVYMEAGGDEAKLVDWASKVEGKYKGAFKGALKLSPENKERAVQYRQMLEDLWTTAYDEGVIEFYVEDYVRHEWDNPEKAGKKTFAKLYAGFFSAKPKESMQRFFDDYFEGIQAGYKPTNLGIGYQLVAGQRSIRGAILAKKFLKGVMKVSQTDGRPTVVIGGVGRPVKLSEADKQRTLFVKPNVREHSTNDYRFIDHPALRRWKWIGKTEDGYPIYMEGNMWIHPNAYKQFNALFGTSALRSGVISEKVPIVGGKQPGRRALRVSAFVKGSILIGPFHHAHMDEHALFHKVNPYNLPDIDFEKRPVLKELVEHGLMLSSHRALDEFGEGLASGGLFHRIPGAGNWLRSYQEWLFGYHIPHLKAAMAEHAYDRAMKYYEKPLADGRLTRDQLLRHVANESNAAFGEQNYKYMGRNPTLQDVFRLLGLAPDFLEARFRFAGQAVKRYGREQFMALLRGALIMGVTAQVSNVLFSDEHRVRLDRPFSLFVGDREFTPRSVVGDIHHFFTNPRRFFYWRLNPLWGRPVVQLLSGLDKDGRKVGLIQTVRDTLASWTPIPAQEFVKRPEEDPLLQIWYGLLSSVGVTNYPARTPFQKYAFTLDRPAYPKTEKSKEKSKLVLELIRDQKSGEKAIQRALNTGKIADKDVNDIEERALHPSKFAAKEMTLEELAKGIESSRLTDQEREEIADVFIDKIDRAANEGSINDKKMNEYYRVADSMMKKRR